jgi:hypothetical protein
MKTCSKCGETKPLDEFFRHAGNKTDGHKGTCKLCSYPHKPILPADQKRCSRCKEAKHLSEFVKNRGQPKGVSAYCKPCGREYRKEWEKNSAEVVAARYARRLREAEEQDLTQYKTCRRCGESRQLLEFYAHRSTADRRANYCKHCNRELMAIQRELKRDERKAAAKAYHAAHRPEQLAKRREWLLALYGLKPADYDAMLAAQGGACAICGEPGKTWADRNLNVDHDHETNKVRGLLCGRCNCMLGYARDRTDVLERGAAYLRAAAE